MSVTPYLAVPDAQAAIGFYGEALGAVEKFRLPAEDGRRIMHAELEVAGGRIFLSDMGPAPQKPAASGWRWVSGRRRTSTRSPRA